MTGLRETAGRGRRQRFNFQDSEDFLAGDYRQEFLVGRILVQGQPAVIGGPSKAMKTSTTIDLGVSIATGHPFLGKFAVPKRRRVAIVSGESGQFTLKETCLRILESKGLDRDALHGWLKWEFTLPTFSDLTMMVDFAKRLADLAVDVVVIDPTYLALGDVDARSVFDMGRALRPVAEHLITRGITPVLVHHANRALPAGEVMGLEHLSHAGLAEYARQWLLLSRRKKYQMDGVHDLWLAVGGSAGHGGLWSVRVEEGVADEDFRGRRWGLDVKTSTEVETEVMSDREKMKQTTAENDQRVILMAIDDEVAAGQQAATQTRIEAIASKGAPKVKKVLMQLLEAGAVEKIQFRKKVGHGAEQNATGYRRAA